jgi:hypothetical protein
MRCGDCAKAEESRLVTTYVLLVRFLAEAKLPDTSAYIFFFGILLVGIAVFAVQLAFTIRDAAREWRPDRHDTFESEVGSD